MYYLLLCIVVLSQLLALLHAMPFHQVIMCHEISRSSHSQVWHDAIQVLWRTNGFHRLLSVVPCDLVTFKFRQVRCPGAVVSGLLGGSTDVPQGSSKRKLCSSSSARCLGSSPRVPQSLCRRLAASPPGRYALNRVQPAIDRYSRRDRTPSGLESS